MKRFLLAAAALLAAGCSDEGSDPLAASFVPCVFNTATRLAVGETLTLTDAQASTICLEAPGGGADFTLVPFVTSPDGEARVRVEAVGANLLAPLGPPDVRVLASEDARDFNLRGGGAAYLRFGIGASARVGLRLTSDDGPPPPELRFSLVRTR